MMKLINVNLFPAPTCTPAILPILQPNKVITGLIVLARNKTEGFSIKHFLMLGKIIIFKNYKFRPTVYSAEQ